MVIKNHYPRELRHAVLTAYFSGHESCAAVAQRFSIEPSTVSNWIQRDRNKYIELEPNRENSSIFGSEESKISDMPKEKLSLSELEARVQLLEQQLEEERMRSICLDKVIDIAERDLNIVIRKKSGAKQSKK